MTQQSTSPQSSRIAGFDYAVVIPLYNKGPYIERALAAIAEQNPLPREIIVIDDGSTDDGPDRVARAREINPAITLVRQSNAGVSAARNRGIAIATSDWIAFLDADDIYLPWFAEELAALIAEYPAAKVVAARFREVRSNSVDAAIAGLDRSTPNAITRGLVATFYDRWWRGSLFFTSSVAVKRIVLQSFDAPFPIAERHGEDLELFFRLAETVQLALSDRVSSFYVVGVADSLTSTGIARQPLPAFERLRARVDSPQFPELERAGCRRCLATYWMTVARANIRRGDFRSASELLLVPITRYRPIYWLRTASLLVAAVLAKSTRRPNAALARPSLNQEN